jgi:hypothetical protein
MFGIVDSVYAFIEINWRNKMKTSVVTGREMLKLCNRANIISEVKTDVSFYLIEHAGQKLFIESITVESNSTVCVVTKNSDFTEGRGTMKLHKVFGKMKAAIEYIMTQEGIYGSKQAVSNYAGVNVHGKPYCVSGFNGYDIKIIEVE